MGTKVVAVLGAIGIARSGDGGEDEVVVDEVETFDSSMFCLGEQHHL